MSEKTLNRLLILGYAGVVIGYGVLLYVKLKTPPPSNQPPQL